MQYSSSTKNDAMKIIANKRTLSLCVLYVVHMGNHHRTDMAIAMCNFGFDNSKQCERAMQKTKTRQQSVDMVNRSVTAIHKLTIISLFTSH